MSPETDNSEKGQLLKKSAHHRELLEEEVKMISERSEKILTRALMIGGTLALTYFLVSSLSGESKKVKSKSRKKVKRGESETEADTFSTEDEEEPREAGIVSQIGAVLLAQATGFLLSIAREKLVEFLESQGIKKEHSNEPS